MAGQYQGNYVYEENSVQIYAPVSWGVYYCVHIEQGSRVVADYIGKASGQGVTIKSRLLNHLSGDNWPEVSHFGYILCSSAEEAQRLEIEEINRCNPKYNKRVG